MAGYDEMMGLEFGEFGSFLDGQMFKDALVASAAGGVGVLAGTWAINKLLGMDNMPQFVKDNRKVAKGVLQIGAGLVLGRVLYDRSREASMGVLGGLGALGAANIINSFMKDNAVALEGDDELSGSDSSLLSNYDNMAALAALETTSVSSAPDAFQGFADPTVTQEALMGFNGLDGAVVQTETLGYAPYLS